MTRAGPIARAMLGTGFLAAGLLTGVIVDSQRPSGSRPITAPRSQGGQAPRSAFPLAVDRGVHEAYAKLPLTFVENAGQVDSRVRFYGHGPGYAFYFTPQALVFSFLRPAGSADKPSTAELRPIGRSSDERASRGVTLALRFVNPNPAVALEGRERAPGQVNYLIGNDPTRWHTGLASYSELVYRELWPGIDMRVRGRAGELKYEFLVRPGARLEDIRLAYDGARGLSVDSAGKLRIATALGELTDTPPVSYQPVAGRQVKVASRYVLRREQGHGYGFAVGTGYDPEYPLVIDPGLVYSTFLGGFGGFDRAFQVAVDAAGDAYLTGYTFSPDFPTTPGALDRTHNGIRDVFVTKLNATGSGLVYSTVLGGSSEELGFGIALDSAGNAYVTGFTRSADFPTTPGAFDRTPGVGRFNFADAFVTKLNVSGSGLVYSSFLAGNDSDYSLDITVDAAGNTYVTGTTASLDFPTTPGAFDRSHAGGNTGVQRFDAFATKLNASGSALSYSTFIGGRNRDTALGIAIDSAGRAYVTGFTLSSNFPATPGAFDRTHAGGGAFDVFVAKLNAMGSTSATRHSSAGQVMNLVLESPSTQQATPMSRDKRSPMISRPRPARSTEGMAALLTRS